MAKTLKDKLPDDLRRQIDILKEERIEPIDEPIVKPLIENKLRKGNQEFTQFKVNIPKRLADGINLSNKTHEVRFVLQKSKDNRGESRLVAEFVKKTGGRN